MALPSGKGFFVYQGHSIYNGDPSQAARSLTDLGCSWVALKIADGPSVDFASYPGKMQEAVWAFRSLGLSVWGWQYIYGGVYIHKKTKLPINDPQLSPELEAATARRVCAALALDGYIIDPEKEYKVSAPGARALRFGSALGKMTIPVALSSYRYPKSHPEFPYREFASFSDLFMPQVYWNPSAPILGYGPVPELSRCLLELAKVRQLPVVPIGRAYIGDGHKGPIGSELTDFLVACKDKHALSGAAFWVLDHVFRYDKPPFTWSKDIAAFTWAATPHPVPIPPTPGSWAFEITAWARLMGYNGPDPDEGT